jgi:NAD+ synthase
MNRLVLGTENRTEWLLGTVTKYGARRGDLLPIGGCYRTEVGNLAGRLGIPDGILEADADGQERADRSVGDVSPPTLDAVLVKLVDEDKEIDQTALELGIDAETVRQYAELVVDSRHKREQPRTPATARDDRYDRFHEIELKFY